MFGSNQNTSGTGFGFGGGNNPNQNSGAFGSGTGSFGASNAPSGTLQTAPLSDPPAFGTPSAFGQRPANSGLFGSGTTSAFGQPQTQPTTTSAFGSSTGFGNTSTTTSAFGQNTGTSGGLFGAKPTTSAFGGGSFGGGTGGFGNTGGFGTSPNTTTTSAFGSSALTFGQQANASPVPPTGSQNPPYQITSEKETGQTYTTNFHAISMMPAYRNASFEEMRLADYAQGRRYGTSGGFGAPATFGGTTTGTSGAFGGFGSSSNPNPTNAFGQPTQQTNTTGGFGTGAFGSGNTGGFGSSNQTSAFGQSTPQATGGFGTGATGAFGSGSTGGGFGATNTSGGFGSSTGTGAFGSAQKPGAFTLGGGFGSNTANTTTGGFGASAGSAFGTPANNTTPSAFSTNITPSTSTWGGFGSNAQTGGAFGANTATQENKPAFGGFGANASNTTAPATGGFGSFGQKPAGTGGFGGGFGSGTGGFGNTNPQSTGGTGLFGGNAPTAGSTGTGLGTFGSGNTNNQPSGFGSGSSLFNKPATSGFSLGAGGLGGNIAATGTGLFGSGGSSTFGSGGGFNPGGGSAQTNPGGGLFGTPQTQQNNNQLQQSIMSSPYGSNPLFQMGSASTYGGDTSKPIVPIATLVPKEGKDEKNPAILAGFRLTPSGTKSRFSLSGSPSPLSGSPFNNRKRDVLGLGTPTKVLLSSSSSGTGIELTPEAFVVPKRGLKSLEISRTKRDLNITGGEAKGIEASPLNGALGGSIKSSTDSDLRLDSEAREKERQRMEQDARKKLDIDESKKKPAVQSTFASPSREEDRPAPPVQRHPSPPQSDDTDKTLDINTAEEGGYWTLPSMPQILALRDIRAVSGFVVGRKGYGQVRFLQPVDLSQVRSIPDIPGSIVVFDLKICTVYPDETVKPPVGKGLNVPAIITLEKCWPLSKETRRPILDVENPRFIAHVERLKRQPDTEFIDYIADSGSWIFKVLHFSSYDALFRDEPVSADPPRIANQVLCSAAPLSSVQDQLFSQTEVHHLLSNLIAQTACHYTLL